MEEYESPKTEAARRNDPKINVEENPKLDFEFILLWSMQMGFTAREAWRLTYGQWSDYFEEYKKIYNMKMRQVLFTEPRQIESIMKTLGGGVDGKKPNRRNH